MSVLPKLFTLIAASSGVIAVCLGAFGAHALKARLEPAALAAWQTAVQYQFYHTLALLVVALLLQQSGKNTALLSSATLFVLGLLLFCGSLFALALGGPRWLGPVTPIGGTFFIAGWVCLLVFAIRS